MHEVIRRVVDDAEFLEVQARWAENLICGFARLGGYPVGVVANQPRALAGVLDISSSVKGARFVRTCDAFNIPLVTFVDVPGLPAGDRPGVGRHHPARREAALRLLRGDRPEARRDHAQGVRRRLRRHELEARRAPTSTSRGRRAEVAVMGPDGAVNIVFRKELESADDPDARRAELVEEYREQFANPFTAAERGYVDDVIAPRRTRPRSHHRARGERRKARPTRPAESTATSRCERRADRRHAGADARGEGGDPPRAGGAGPGGAGAPDPPANPGSGTAPSGVTDP